MVPEPERILVRLPNWVGDVVMATPLLRELRSSFPRARIVAAARAHLLPIIAGLPYVDALLPIERRAQPWAVGGALRGEGSDLALILPHSLRSALEALFAGIPRRVGYQDGSRPLLLTQALPVHRVGRLRPMPMVRHYLALLTAIGGRVRDVRLELRPTEGATARAAAFLTEQGIAQGEPLIGITPGASFGTSKMWTVDGYAEVAEQLGRRLGARVLLLAGPGEAPITAAIAAGVRGTGVIDTGPRPLDLDALKGIVSRLSLLVTNDTGTRHYGAAFDIPTVVLMGPTHPGYTDYPAPRTRVLLKRVPCWPCHQPVCPLHEDAMRCLRAIAPAEVISAAETLLAA